MKKILSIVKNGFINDTRVDKTCRSLLALGYDIKLIAEKASVELPIIEKADFIIYRVPVFSALYSRRESKTIVAYGKKKKNINSKVLSLIQRNELRKSIVSELNSFLFNIQTILLGIKLKPEVIISNDLDTLLAGYLISRILNAKLIYDSHEIWLGGNSFQSASKLKQKIWSMIEPILIRKADQVIVTTDLRAEHLKNKYNLNKVWVIRNCPEFQVTMKSNLLRDEFDIPKECKIILYQGLLDIRRGIINMVDLISEIENTALVFIGKGVDKKKLYDYIEFRKMKHKIFIKDEVPHSTLLRYTASADVGLQLLKNTGINHYSTISNKIFEYIMAGIAILASDFPEIKKIVKGNNIGEVVNPNNLEEIKRKLLYILDEERMHKIQTNLSKIQNNYIWENEEIELKKMISNL